MKTMKEIRAGFLILSFVSVAVFGFLAMEHQAGHDLELCLAKTVQNAPCEKSGSLFASTYHARVFKSFSLALLAALAVFTAFLLFMGRSPDRAPAFPGRFPEKISLKFASPLRLEKLKWLAFHETSPTSILTPA
ncbi:MAG: hypothetical protein Q8Q97_02490 [bacterium]|nr:hypothetical protein [bacterium]